MLISSVAYWPILIISSPFALKLEESSMSTGLIYSRLTINVYLAIEVYAMQYTHSQAELGQNLNDGTFLHINNANIVLEKEFLFQCLLLNSFNIYCLWNLAIDFYFVVLIN